MGYNIGAKGVALGLYAITNGDVAKAKRIWARLANYDPNNVSEALGLVEEAVRQETDD
jgi:hypothetical protein